MNSTSVSFFSSEYFIPKTKWKTLYCDRIIRDKKAFPVDTTDEQFCQWLNKAMSAKKRYLAGELTEEEAIAIIYVPKKDELFQKK